MRKRKPTPNGSEIAAARKAAEMTQAELAVAAEIPRGQQAISQIENDDMYLERAGYVDRIRTVLRMW